MLNKKISIPITLGIVFFLNGITFGQTQNITICPGESVALTPAETSAFAYNWTPNTSLNDSNIQNPTATPSQTITYTVVSSQRTANNLVRNGDFELGNQDFTSEYIFAGAGASFDQGNYGVSDNPKLHNNVFSNCNDHTDGVGKNMLVADGASGQKTGVPPKAKLWIQTITVVPHTDYAFSSWITNIADGALSSLNFSINGIAIGEPILSLPGKCNWQEFYVVWNSGTANTATISIAEGTGGTVGNDFALDDIAFYKITKKTEDIKVTVRVPATVPIITGNPSICIDKTGNLNSSTNGGTWTSSNERVATIDGTGQLSPKSIGNTNIIYRSNDICNTPSAPFTVTVTEAPILEPIKGLAKLIIGEQTTLSINSTSGTWKSSDESIVQIAPDGTVKGINDGESEITYTVNIPCVSVSLPFKISVLHTDDLYVPNAFTPNGDGNNDEFRIYGSLIDKIEFSVFNQWGELIFKSTDLTKGWTGTYKGEKQPAGVYVYTAKLKMINGKEVIKKGAINLIR